MPANHIHIIAFDVPYPVDHGGFFDLFYKLVFLHKKQMAISLHCFEYGRTHPEELNKYCKEVFYYPRQTGLKGLSASLPYIVASRRSKALLRNLSLDNDPIILEGTHCTFLLNKNLFPGRTILYRLHNIEHVYYDRLFRNEKDPFKRIYYFIESMLLKRYEIKVLAKASVVLTVSENDLNSIKKMNTKATIEYLPVFIPAYPNSKLTGLGDYCLYHGNLSVAENEQVAIWLLEKVFPTLNIPLIIAGRKPSKNLFNAVAKSGKATIVANPSDTELMNLIQQAQININLSFNETGVKLKLINSLYLGRHCIANSAAVINSHLESLCQIANTAEEIQAKILQLQNQSISQDELNKRREMLQAIYNNQANAQKLIALLYSHYR